MFRRVFCVVLLLSLACTYAAADSAIKTEDVMIQPCAIDDGYLVELYESYINSSGNTYIAVSLVDLDLNGIPELVGITDWAHVGLFGEIVTYDPESKDLCIYEEAATCFGMETKLSLCVDGDGNIRWYENSSYAGCGMTSHVFNTVLFDSNMDMITEEWIGEFSQEVWDETTQEYTYPETYRVYGQEVGEDTYRKEDAKRRRLTVLYTYDPLRYNYPDDWYDACQQYSVIK